MTPSEPPAPNPLAGVVQVDSIAALTDPRTLADLLGPVADVATELAPPTDGTTRAVHRHVHVRSRTGRTMALWLKENRPDTDWTAQSTGDAVGREAALLTEPRLAAIWESVGCPYRAFAVQDGAYAVLMDDLSEHLVPQKLGWRAGRALGLPEWLAGRGFTVEEEDAILGAVAGMHARYWNAEVTRLPWLQSPWYRMFFMGPHDDTPSDELIGRRERWGLALPRLPAPVAQLLLAPTDELAARCEGLPWTVYHGDLKPTNLALPPDGRLVAVDWGMVGAGPATLDLFWYLFLAQTRRARPHEVSLARYRQLLEGALGERVPEAEWARLIDVGHLCGAIMTLPWLAENIRRGVPGAEAEWDWRVQQLERLT